MCRFDSSIQKERHISILGEERSCRVRISTVPVVAIGKEQTLDRRTFHIVTAGTRRCIARIGHDP
ncbi:MAG: hypothetical protein ACI88C_000758 [Acidimicrobiales bacterium]|jgi:hypothetical protein